MATTLGTLSSETIYKATPLIAAKRQIRLLEVQPGAFDEPLRCSLRIATLGTFRRPRYETISYCWGDSTRQTPIAVDGTAINVPQSSSDAIRRARVAERPRTIWIDAVCINQTDLEEKTSQVGMMGTVYQRSIGNLVYLGEDVDRVAPAVVETFRHAKPFYENGADVFEVAAEESFLTKDGMDRVGNVFALPWFTRLWVVQEAALSPHNTCIWGNSEFDLVDAVTVAVGGFMRLLQLEECPGREHFQRLGKALELYQALNQAEQRDTIRWQDFNRIAIASTATDPRDHVFALTGFLQHVNRLRSLPALLHTDYRKSVREVYRDCTRASLHENEDDLLANVCHSSANDLLEVETPSWAVSWNRPEAYGELINSQGDAGWTCHFRERIIGAFPVERRLEFSDVVSDPDSLVVKGYIVGKVAWTSPVSPSYADKDKPYASLSRFLDIVVGRIEGSFVGDHDSHCYDFAADVLTAGTWRDTHVGLGLPSLEAAGAGLKALHTLANNADGDDVDHGTRKSPVKLSSPAGKIKSNIMAQRRIFTLQQEDDDDEKGRERFGNGPHLIREADLLYIMQGGHYVHVLRRVNTDEEHYLLAGAAWIPGMMEGEVLDMGIEPEWITIR
ncbi:hypothetical protein M409DRAFT_21759 [Zasmidium cellare ATCC 36951]|uniref:Heterokaryon incompatibility domain-containing protein n=1 Tax=Zasmidium cellare ATCC 36951 TaxID=1080233 RepID=A0A6A6CR68_ZASCE|nr:uncharacterized protein M409DRAFT_21759 [Zasmidium cellare ATCC 36951]KAF2168322.1 hypothetical protein M409DRAFT_21759 [Zasmidium cellare ATCC 36951]